MEDNMGFQGNLPQGGKQKRTWLWIVIGVVVLCGIVVAALFVTGILGGIKGNKGVLAVAQYLRDQQEDMQALNTEEQKALQEGLLSGPFEVDMDMDMETEFIKNMGLPIDKISLNMDIKYDLKDLGIKIGAPGFEMFGASAQVYLIEDELILSSMAGTDVTKIETDADLDELMPIGERAKALLPFLPQDEQTMRDIVMQLALAVPDEYTAIGKDDAYSPKKDDEIEMDVITTELDKEALEQIVANLDANLEDEEELRDTLQDIIDRITQMFDEDDSDRENELGDLAENPDQIPDINIAWSVYKRGSDYVGISFEVMNEDGEEISYAEMKEFDGTDVYTWTRMVANDWDLEVLNTVSYDGNSFTSDGQIKAVGISEQDVAISIDMQGKGKLYQKTKDRYEITGNMEIEIEGIGAAVEKLLESMPFDISGIIGDITIGKLESVVEYECDFRFDDDLDILKDDDDWNEIYDIDWEAGESLMPELNLFGDML